MNNKRTLKILKIIAIFLTSFVMIKLTVAGLPQFKFVLEYYAWGRDIFASKSISGWALANELKDVVMLMIATISVSYIFMSKIK